MKENEFKTWLDDSVQPGAVVMKDGVHFGYYAAGIGQPELLLYEKGSEVIAASIPFPKQEAAGGFYHMKVKLRASTYEYNFRENGQVVTDPYARKIEGRGTFGSLPPKSAHGIRGSFLTKSFDWGEDVRPQLAYPDVVMYHLHVRGFTKQKNSGVRHKGTFAGLREKLPYLRELGINQIRLMPVYDFAELTPRLELKGVPKTQKEAVARAAEQLPEKEAWRMNYWGYGPGFYFAPKSSYAASPDPDLELKQLIRAIHALGMELILEFPFTEDTDMLLILECLRYWVQEYHVDGFVLMARSTVCEELARLPMFRDVKLIGEWFPDGLVQKNAQMWHSRLAESNDGFMNDCRRMLRGDGEQSGAFAVRLRRNPKGCAVINYVTTHDGFTLEDLVSYDYKHNQANGEQDRDGTDYNYSWNCGVEGPTRKKEILRLRMRQKKNALAMLLFAQGVPMLLAGDEFGNTQDGNNNPYCHDSELTWLGWNQSKSTQQLHHFVQSAIAYRKVHPMLHQATELLCADRNSCGYPDLSYHSDRAWYCDFSRTTRQFGCMYAGGYAGESGFIYIAYNLYWTEQTFALPLLAEHASWYRVMDTSEPESFLLQPEALGKIRSFRVPPRTIMILEGREDETE